MFPSAQRRSEVGINAVADDKIEGTEVLILRLVLTNATQTAVNNAGNIFFQDTLNISVVDVTGNLIADSTILYEVALFPAPAQLGAQQMGTGSLTQLM